MYEIKSNTMSRDETKAWLKRSDGTSEVIRVVTSGALAEQRVYQLYTAFEETGDYLGRVLFDAVGYWIYDGDELSIAEQEQVAEFIANYAEKL